MTARAEKSRIVGGDSDLDDGPINILRRPAWNPLPFQYALVIKVTITCLPSEVQYSTILSQTANFPCFGTS
jgi:hypothetical protein